MTVQDACHLADIIRAAQGNQPVARLLNGDTVYGTARNICDRNGHFGQNTDDVRDLFLRVRSRTGLMHFWKVGVLMDELPEGIFAVNFPQP
ncbi:hypothetical protein [Actinophytocola sediminis]